MSTYAKLKKEAELLKLKTRDDEIENLKYQTEKDDLEKIFKSLKIDNKYYKKKEKNLNKKSVFDRFRNFNWWCWIECR